MVERCSNYSERIDVCKECESILENARALGTHVPLERPEPETVTITEEELLSAIRELGAS